LTSTQHRQGVRGGNGIEKSTCTRRNQEKKRDKGAYQDQGKEGESSNGGCQGFETTL